MNSFIKLFPSPSFVAVLTLFLAHPEEEIYQSRIVEVTKCALVQVQRALKRLEETGLITKTKSGNRIYYKANRRHPAFEDIKKALFKTVLFGDLLKKALNSVKDKIQFSFIYGSLARGEESFDSDIDLFIIGDLGMRDVASLLGVVGHEIGREINPTVYPLKEFKKKIKEKNTFIREIMSKPKIWLIGEESEFAKMGQ
ncbi:nucleotidyltransferase domain-containing protein [Candidatus Protochlamydia phocaeensis]|uniref:nucleotidyltransferase domain-containing protein n=1 Tax=Candidatus Protochlamydia phocaeensis TaxID=1414722 RepID=UPI000837E595|nr:nucleotidyltransferase domain-containing protein [Candidatus Protochlamydia phocaeensis]